MTRLLAIYLNDHLLGATGGVELARRMAGTDPDLGRLAADVDEDRAALRRIMDQLDVTADPVKQVAGWVGEKLARLKLNGYWWSRSPLSSLLEQEAMSLGVEGKLAGWRSLRVLAEHDERLNTSELDRLIERAEQQRELLERMRVATAASVLAPTPD